MLQKTLIFLLLVLLLAGCTQAEVETAVAGDAAPEIEAPAEVTAARDAVLDFLREGANECIPPKIARWQAGHGEDMTPAGFDAYRFSSETCTITVTYALTEGAEQVYHVSLGDSSNGFCWQAVVNDNGRIIQTGSAAISETGLGNPSAVYCVEQGYQFEIFTLENGSQCGACVFPGGSFCRSWDYFHGDCRPNDHQLDNSKE